MTCWAGLRGDCKLLCGRLARGWPRADFAADLGVEVSVSRPGEWDAAAGILQNGGGSGRELAAGGEFDERNGGSSIGSAELPGPAVGHGMVLSADGSG